MTNPPGRQPGVHIPGTHVPIGAVAQQRAAHAQADAIEARRRSSRVRGRTVTLSPSRGRRDLLLTIWGQKGHKSHWCRPAACLGRMGQYGPGWLLYPTALYELMTLAHRPFGAAACSRSPVQCV
jgi:hypothetical protein